MCVRERQWIFPGANKENVTLCVVARDGEYVPLLFHLPSLHPPQVISSSPRHTYCTHSKMGIMAGTHFPRAMHEKEEEGKLGGGNFCFLGKLEIK